MWTRPGIRDDQDVDKTMALLHSFICPSRHPIRHLLQWKVVPRQCHMCECGRRLPHNLRCRNNIVCNNSNVVIIGRTAQELAHILLSGAWGGPIHFSPPEPFPSRTHPTQLHSGPHHSPNPFHPAPLNPTSQTTFGQLTICPSENSLGASKQHECFMNQLMRSGLSIVTWNNKKEDL